MSTVWRSYTFRVVYDDGVVAESGLHIYIIDINDIYYLCASNKQVITLWRIAENAHAVVAESGLHIYIIDINDVYYLCASNKQVITLAYC